jgi:tRNA-specific 2-thiouridylase
MDKKKVVVGMSGGVDSSVTAYLLKKQGYQVIGITMKLTCEDENYKTKATIEDAIKVAKKLEIEHHVVDFTKTFQENVIDYFIDEYKIGRTPNPCVECNKYVKFGALLDKAHELGAYYVATGHYAKVYYYEDYKRYVLEKADTDGKDQTYTLYHLKQNQLQHILMPLGVYENKKAIREIAKKIGLIVAEKGESQEICFIEDDDYNKFLKENADYKIIPGDFVDIKGRVVGRHKGIINYTIGQRKGLGLALGKPVYVVEIKPKENIVVVGENKDVFGQELIATHNNFITMDHLETPIDADVKVRYNGTAQKAKLIPLNENTLKVVFYEPVRGITPGQSVVFYNDNLLIGGGIIEQKVK